ncbi:peroxidase 56-like [Argentina anserina]|uniref:peroxidase 56-like n=1 Tax=Argentina anserina TaxID=57926 RepID=UPI00217675AF|nr:peroxidase 56-like [Potentilla anserina]
MTVHVKVHTIGVGRCRAFDNRLYNFTGKGDQDPSLNATYAQFLKPNAQTCALLMTQQQWKWFQGALKNLIMTTILSSSNTGAIRHAALLTNKDPNKIVHELDDNKFLREFAKSMKRMGAFEVVTGMVW